MFVGNIVTQSKVNIDKYFNVVETMDAIIHGLPTLIVGWDIVKTIEPEVDFITRKLSDNIFWTFKKTERRDIFENDLYDLPVISYRLAKLFIKIYKYKVNRWKPIFENYNLNLHIKIIFILN